MKNKFPILRLFYTYTVQCWTVTTIFISVDQSWKKTDAANSYFLHVRCTTTRFSTIALKLTDNVYSQCIFGSTILNTVYEYFIIY